MRAIGNVEERIRAQHGQGSPQMTELIGVRDREAANFTSALRETFKTIVFPMTKALRRVEDFRMEFDRNDYSGEQQIIDTLAKRGKFIPSEQFDAKFDAVRRDAEDIHNLFGSRTLLWAAKYSQRADAQSQLNLFRGLDYGSRICSWDVGHKGSSPQVKHLASRPRN